MDGQKFDSITRALASGTSRRSVLRGMFGSAVGGALAMAGLSRGGAQPAGKVGICHSTGSATNPFVYIEVSANALPAHEAHGDLISCPGAGVLNPETCTCDCGLTCEGNFVLDEGACACVCGLDPATCPRDTVFNEETCSCECTLTDEQCPNLEVADQESCSCFCPVDEIVCPEGTIFNEETCACDDAGNPNPECIGANCGNFLSCGEAGSGCLCFTTADGGGFCAVSVSCSILTGCPNGQSDCPEGELCLVDTCCGDPVCKPISYGCESAAGMRIMTIVDDGPTTGHP